MRYRWAVLAAGTTAQACAAALFVTGVPVLAPTLRAELGLSLGQVGVVIAAGWLGATLTLLPWGLAADRYGERIVLALGLATCAVFLIWAAYAGSFTTLVVALALAGATGASVNAASGRAVMNWFAPSERGFALGIRQTANPIGALVGALAVPPIADAGGSEAAFLFLAALSALGAVVGAAVLRRRDPAGGVAPESIARTLVDRKLWRVCFGSSIYLYAQIATVGYGVLFLHDEHGFSEAEAGLVIAISQVLAAVFRIGVGRWSDIVGSRIGLLRRVGLAVTASLGATALLAGGPVELLVPALALAGGLSSAWNGLAFTAAAELAGAQRSGAAIGFQQTVISGYGVAAPLLFAASVSATSWTAAFAVAGLVPLAAWVALRPLRAY